MSRPWLAGALVLAALAAPEAASADAPVAIVRFRLYKPILVDARGVVGPDQRYEFQGYWDLSKLIWENKISYLKGAHLDKTGVLVYSPQDIQTYKSGVYQGKASWDRKTGEFKEKLELVLGGKLSEAKKNYFGSRAASGKCSTDPFLGPAICEDFKRQWSIPSWDGKPGPIGLGLDADSNRPVAWQAFALAEAQALSQMHKDEPPPASPPPPAAQPDQKAQKAEAPATQSVKPGAPVAVAPAAGGPAQPRAAEQALARQGPVAAAPGETSAAPARPQADTGRPAAGGADMARMRQGSEPWGRCLRSALREGTEVQSCDPAFQDWMKSAQAPNDLQGVAALYDVFIEYLKMLNKDGRGSADRGADPGKTERALSGYLRQLDAAALQMARRSGSAESRQQLGALQAQRSQEAREEIRGLAAQLSQDAPAAQAPAPGAASGRAPQRSGAPAQVPPEPDWGAKRTTPMEAGRVAAERPAQPGARGEPPARGAASPISIEAEALVKAGKASVNGGKVSAQPMAGFGSGWSSNAQLFWSGGAVGAVLDLVIDVPAPGTYGVELYLTRAPDYGNLKVEVDGKSTPAVFTGYAATVSPGGPLMVGRFPLQPGPRRVSFMIVGKAQQSSGYFAGIDQVKLYPVGGP